MRAGGHSGGHGHSGHAREHGELRGLAPGMKPAVFAAEANVVFAPLAPAAEVCAQVEAFLRDLCDRLATAGCLLVRHIKGTLATAAHGILSFTVTSLRGDPRVAAAVVGDPAAALLTINVIVFGVPESALSGLVMQAWESRVAAATTWRR